MNSNFPALYDGNEMVRMMYRANHIYLLLASLINVMCGFSMPKALTPVLRGSQLIGSVLLVAGLVVLLVAFYVEPSTQQLDRPWTFWGVMFLLVGVVLHWLVAIDRHLRNIQ